MVEDLTRFITAIDHLAQIGEPVSEWHVHHVASSPIASQSADLLGVRGTVGGFVRAGRVLLPRSSFCGGRLGDRRIPRLRALIHARYSIPGNQAPTNVIVYKRSGARSILNHAAVLAEVRRLWKGSGSVLEHSGEGSFVEQMRMHAAAAVLIGPHGSGMTNAISMLAGAAVVEVLPETGYNRLNMCYVALAYSLGLRYFALRAPGFDCMGAARLPIESLADVDVWNATV